MGAAEEVRWSVTPRQLPPEHPSSLAEAPGGRGGLGKTQDQGLGVSTDQCSAPTGAGPSGPPVTVATATGHRRESWTDRPAPPSGVVPSAGPKPPGAPPRPRPLLAEPHRLQPNGSAAPAPAAASAKRIVYVFALDLTNGPTGGISDACAAAQHQARRRRQNAAPRCLCVTALPSRTLLGIRRSHA